MSEAFATPVTPLGGAEFDGLVSVREMPPQGMILLRGDLSAPAITQTAQGFAGAGLPGLPEQRRAVTEGDRSLLWMSPDELLLLCPYDAVPDALDGLTEQLGDAHALAVDISDARACFELRGRGLREVLAKLTPADVSALGLPLGEVRRSRMAQVPAAFWLTSETRAQVICFRSVAHYAFDLLKTAAAPGSAVGVF